MAALLESDETLEEGIREVWTKPTERTACKTRDIPMYQSYFWIGRRKKKKRRSQLVHAYFL